MTENWTPEQERAYTDGESSGYADWIGQLSEVTDENIQTPFELVAYIGRLHARIRELERRL